MPVVRLGVRQSGHLRMLAGGGIPKTNLGKILLYLRDLGKILSFGIPKSQLTIKDKIFIQMS